MRIPSLKSETFGCLMSAVSLFYASSFTVIGTVKDDYFPLPFSKISAQ